MTDTLLGSTRVLSTLTAWDVSDRLFFPVNPDPRISNHTEAFPDSYCLAFGSLSPRWQVSVAPPAKREIAGSFLIQIRRIYVAGV
jgi:hypothetical protein